MNESVTDPSTPNDADGFGRFWRSASGFWHGRSRRLAWGLIALMAVVVLCDLAVKYWFNFWYRDFFDALEKRNSRELWRQVLLFMMLTGASITIALAGVWSRMTTQREWRRWMTEQMIALWLKDGHYRRLRDLPGDHRNAEYRIAEDVRVATDAPIDFGVGLLTSLLTVFIFVDVLWTTGGSFTLVAFGTRIILPGYLVIAVVAYSALMTLGVLVAGRRMVRVVKQTDHAEAMLRHEGSRLREDAEKAARRDSEPADGRPLQKALGLVIARWRDLCWQLIRTTVISHGNSLLAPFVGLVLCAPKYLADTMSLGEIVQAAAAFVAVQGAFNWLVENYPRLASWTASAHRVSSLLISLDALEAAERTAEPEARAPKSS